MWNKQVNNFGSVQPNQTLYTSFEYLGSQKLSSSNFYTSCGCTSVAYNPETKVASVGLNTGPMQGEKNASITVNYPDKSQEILRLVATINN
jgi:hypothetical protein